MDKTIVFSLFHDNSKVELFSTIFYNKFFVKFFWHHVNGIFKKGNVSFNIYCNVKKSEFVKSFLNLQYIQYDDLVYYNKFLDVNFKFQDCCEYVKDVLTFDYDNYANFFSFSFCLDEIKPYLFVFVERYMNVNNVLYCKTSGVEIYYNDTWKRIKDIYISSSSNKEYEKNNFVSDEESDLSNMMDLNLNELIGRELI